MSKYDDCRRVDNRYTTAIGMSSWRFFNIGKYKNQKVKDVYYFNPFYVAWCLLLQSILCSMVSGELAGIQSY